MSRLALCLNSSYFGFFAHAGFLAAVVEQGCRPSQISGSSAGALIAGLFAGGLSPSEIIELLTALNLRKILHEWSVPVRATKMLFNRRGVTGAFRPVLAVAALREQVGDRQIEDCTDPRLAVAVTNLSGMKAETIRAGSLADFVVASCAYPGIFAAHPIGGNLYWDGGIANNVPISHWADDPDVDEILIHLVSSDSELAVRETSRKLNIFDSIGLSHQIVCEENFRLQAELLRRAGKRLTVLRTVTPRPGLTRMSLGPRLVEMGRATALTNAGVLAALRA